MFLHSSSIFFFPHPASNRVYKRGRVVRQCLLINSLGFSSTIYICTIQSRSLLDIVLRFCFFFFWGGGGGYNFAGAAIWNCSMCQCETIWLLLLINYKSHVSIWLDKSKSIWNSVGNCCRFSAQFIYISLIYTVYLRRFDCIAIMIIW